MEYLRNICGIFQFQTPVRTSSLYESRSGLVIFWGCWGGEMEYSANIPLYPPAEEVEYLRNIPLFPKSWPKVGYLPSTKVEYLRNIPVYYMHKSGIKRNM